jgi:glutamine synthetase type III
MKDIEFEAYKYGIPAKTRHNEVAPNQFELAPIYGECNLAVDQNLLMMSIMKKVARRHGFRVLLHEKPFAGVNGSGKHNNWSLGTDTGVILYAPGKTAEENLQFIAFITTTLMAVHKHNALLKASSGLLSASALITSGTETSRITFIPPFRSKPKLISISRHCFSVQLPNHTFSLERESR